MILSFTLSMPNNNAWNGKWTGAGKPYVIVKNFGKTKKGTAKAESILQKQYHTYNFGDGWCAAISIDMVDAKEAAKLRRKSAGFYGYDWMVDSIISNGTIKPPQSG